MIQTSCFLELLFAATVRLSLLEMLKKAYQEYTPRNLRTTL